MTYGCPFARPKLSPSNAVTASWRETEQKSTPKCGKGRTSHRATGAGGQKTDDDDVLCPPVVEWNMLDSVAPATYDDVD
jgi:hypothetical protein